MSSREVWSKAEGAGCAQCAGLPHLPTEVMLHAWIDFGHTYNKFQKTLEEGRVEVVAQEPREGYMCLQLNRAQQAFAAALIRQALSEEELTAARGLLLGPEDSLGPSHFARVTALRAAVGLLSAGWLVEALEQEKLETWFQPIVQCESHFPVYGYECLMRLRRRDDSVVLPSEILHTAAEAQLLYQLDLAARRQAVRAASEAGITHKIFVNFSPAAIYDPRYCLRSTVALVERLGLRPEEIVFEIIEAEKPQSLQHLQGIVGFYQQRGFGIALDDLGAGYSSLNLVHQLRPDYIKLDRELVDGVSADPVRQEIASALLNMAKKLGIVTIAEGIEHPSDLEWIIEKGADLAQGYLFSKPAPAPEPGPFQI